MTEPKRMYETGAEYRKRIETPTEPTIVEALQARAADEREEQWSEPPVEAPIAAAVKSVGKAVTKRVRATMAKAKAAKKS